MAEFLMTSEAARIVGMSAQNVRVLSTKGKLRCYKTSSGVRFFDRKEVENFARARRRERSKVERG